MPLNRQRIEQLNTTRVSKLHPKLQEMANEFLAKCNQEGHIVLITSGLRTFDEQKKLYAIGRTLPGAIVTKARPGQSYHQYGLAFDHLILKPQKNNKDVYLEDWSEESFINKTIPIAVSVGLESGAFWKTFKDIPHLQFLGGWHWNELLKLGYGQTLDISNIILPKPEKEETE